MKLNEYFFVGNTVADNVNIFVSASSDYIMKKSIAKTLSRFHNTETVRNWWAWPFHYDAMSIGWNLIS